VPPAYLTFDGVFRLIHCETRKLVYFGSLTDHELENLALSYVWGASKSDDASNSDKDSLRRPLPATVEDALFVSQALRYRYPWVDKYCIN
jgi:hypothetical protein